MDRCQNSVIEQSQHLCHVVLYIIHVNVYNIVTCYDSWYCGFQNGEKSLDIYQIRNEAELDKVRQRRRKKLRKREKQQLPEGGSDDVTITITDELSFLATVKMDAKIKYG